MGFSYGDDPRWPRGLRQCFSNFHFSRVLVPLQNRYTYRCQHKTCTRTAVNTKHVHVPLSIQNMYTYHCHNTKHVHVPLSQHKTCIRTTVTTQNMYTGRFCAGGSFGVVNLATVLGVTSVHSDFFLN